MNAYTYDIDSFSDLHKDARGFRPGGDFWEWVQSASPDELQEKWDSLIQEMNASEEYERKLEEQSLVALKQELARITSENNVSMDSAIRMMHERYRTNGDNQYLDYSLGVAYGTIENLLKGN